MRIVPVLLIIFIGFSGESFSQCNVADFNVPSQVCKNQNFVIDHELGPGSYDWDFCAGDLNNSPYSTLDGTLSGAVGRPAVEFAYDGNVWYGFLTGTWTNTLFRLTYANGIDQPHTQLENLGDLSGILNNPGQIRIIRESGQWYGILHNAGTNELLRLTFNGSLSSEISASLLVDNVGTINSGFGLGKDKVHGWVCVISDANNAVSVIRLGNALSVPAQSDILTSGSIANPNNIGDLDLIEQCGKWFGLVNNFGNGNVYRLEFDANLFSIPAITQISALPINNGGRIRFLEDAGEVFAVITSLDGPIHKLAFGSNISNDPAIVEETTLTESVGPNTYGIGVVKDNSEWIIRTINLADGKLSRIYYERACSAESPTSNKQYPVLSYKGEGNFIISLNFISETGEVFRKTKAIQVVSLEAPSVTFSAENVCANHDVVFETSSSATILNYEWQFGDGNSSSTGNPTHIYSTGIYEPRLTVTGTNGCTNTTSSLIEIFDPPGATFTVPTGLVCTNAQVTFQNSTVDLYNGFLTYKWYVNDVESASTRDFQFTFHETGTKSVRLATSIPGCTSEHTETIAGIQAGPFADFTIDGSCDNQEIHFLNQSAGNIAGYYWEFSSGTTSNDPSPLENFVPGNYSAVLKTTGINGCESVVSKTFDVFPAPTADFQTLTSLLCTEGTVALQDRTPVPSGSVIVAWQWNFDDNTSSDQKNPNHQFMNAGSYNVGLEVITNHGCSDTFTKTLNILPLPTAEFSYTTVCKNEVVTLSAEESNAKLYQWKIGDKAYTSQKAPHTFRTEGEFLVTLKVTGSNGCDKTSTKLLTVPLPLVPDFLVYKNCAGSDAQLEDVTQGEQIVEWSWQIGGDSKSGKMVSHKWNNEGDKDVRLTVKGVSGCTYFSDKVVTVVPQPTANFTMSQEIGSPPVNILLNNHSSDADYSRWDFGDGNTSTMESPEHLFQHEGDYIVSLTALTDEGCEDTVYKTLKLSAPAPDLNIVGILTGDNPDGSIKIVIILENQGNTIIENQLITVDISDELSLREVIEDPILPQSRYNLTLSYGLRRSQSLTFLCASAPLAYDLTPGQNRSCIQFKNEMFVLPGYPNPVKEYLTVEWVGYEQEIVSLALLNSQGTRIKQATVTSRQGFNQEVLDVRDLQEGVYLMILQGKTTKVTQHILVSN